jgi:hypothetical protein
MTTDSSSRSRTVCSRLRSLMSIPRPDAGSLAHTLGQLWPSYAAYVVVTTPPLKRGREHRFLPSASAALLAAVFDQEGTSFLESELGAVSLVSSARAPARLLGRPDRPARVLLEHGLVLPRVRAVPPAAAG